ncbi:L-asparaginase precursor [Pyrenophora tritici-repentis Pt-1C-BFP]|uniref:L-asparaginase n=1 Tax=Pyrenophora tritici-repentis (strain Pt-1C-BFP) TaxID=426418 RepID=B2W9Y5_PYRTR|nr:L-asparaginase precursor [Pyrenophora tritici-repentis Pt-1C-BFP]EDU49713.1 L-asparaginase precursor [Pyrenophora tritici-repentis Pt-1C-BFP]
MVTTSSPKHDTHPITSQHVKPRIIIHGGAGNITRTSIPRDQYDEYRASLLSILSKATAQLSVPGATALDVATYAVTLLENDPLYNSGKGAVFTRDGKNELECSIMVSNGYRKRGIGCMLLSHVKNPIKLAREFLIRGESADGGGAGDHCQYSGEFAEEMAEKWGLEIVEPSYFFTQKRWDEHQRGLVEEKKKEEAGKASHETSQWEKDNFIPLGTCGAVVVDSFGTVCTATSTGGLTNKVPGRIGDTPTLAAVFQAEEWYTKVSQRSSQMLYQPSASIVSSPLDKLSRGDLRGVIGDCLLLPTLHAASTSTSTPQAAATSDEKPITVRHAMALSGTGNGDTFLRTSAARTTAARSRFSDCSLSEATTWMAGPDGELQKSAGERWDRVHEGVGGIIGIEVVGTEVQVVQDYNGGGMFRAWIDGDGGYRCLVFREDSWESGPEGWGEW